MDSSMKVIDPSTKEAKFMRGTHQGRLGARERQTKTGELNSSEFALKAARDNGLPEVIYGNPLGCGCPQAHLVSAGEVHDGMIEADYHCSSDWHNYVVFEVRTNDKGKDRQIKVNKYGELEDGTGYSAKSLDEF